MTEIRPPAGMMRAGSGAVFMFVMAITLGRLFFISRFDLAGDEALYWLWSRALDLSYFVHPPAVAYTIRLADLAGASGEVGVRLGAILYAAGTTWLVFSTARRVFNSPRAGLYAALVMNCSVGFAALAVLMTPDAPLLFFWSLTLAAVVRAVASSSPQGLMAWTMAGVGLGLALLSKYSAILLVPSVLLALLTTRRPVRGWTPWVGVAVFAAVGAALFSPVIVWNAIHGWVSFKVQVVHRLAASHDPPVFGRSFIEFLLAQVGLLTPPIFFGGVVAVAWLWRVGRNDPQRGLLCWSAVLPFGFFALYSLRGHAEANWAAPAYIAVSVALGGYLASRPMLGWWWRMSLLSSVALVGLVHLQVLTPVLRLPPEMDQTNRVAGWRRLGLEVDRVLARMPPGPVFVLGTDYQMAGEAAFYATTHPLSFTIQSLQSSGAPTHLPGYFWTMAVSARGSQAVCLSGRGPHFGEVAPWFDTIEPEPPIPVLRGGRIIRTYYLARCLNFRGRS